jgi:hypothetical protein
LPALDAEQARQDLAQRYLARFGPASTEDLRWWTGWSLTTTRRALRHLPIEEVDLHGQTGIDLVNADRDIAEEPVATLLPTLDRTLMGWRPATGSSASTQATSSIGGRQYRADPLVGRRDHRLLGDCP